jgi:hypothetical protein
VETQACRTARAKHLSASPNFGTYQRPDRDQTPLGSLDLSSGVSNRFHRSDPQSSGLSAMLTLSPSVPIYLHSEPIDMRKSFDGLFGIIKSDLSRDVRDGGLFMFLNQRLNRLKILYWDTDGIAIWIKRQVIITHAELQCILLGVDLSSVRKRKRYVAPSTSVA